MPALNLASRAADGVHHLLTGSYTNTSLFMLAFDAMAKTLTLQGTTQGYGIHQFVASNSAKDTIYATSMSEPPRLYAWSIQDDWSLQYKDWVDIASSACYFSDINGKYAYAAAGATAQVWSLTEDGGFGQRLQEILYVPPNELATVDKTRSYLLHGSHSADVNKNGYMFIPHLDLNTIFMYKVLNNGTLDHRYNQTSPTEHDSPRATCPSDDGKMFYVITEHTQYLDVYEIGEDKLMHVQRASGIPAAARQSTSTFRSNTVQASRDGKYLFMSTRGSVANSTAGVAYSNGYVAAFELDSNGHLASEDAVDFFEAPLPLGSAAGLRVLPVKDNADPNISDYMYLSDTSEGYMWILGWNPSNNSLGLIATFEYPDNSTPYEGVWLN